MAQWRARGSRPTTLRRSTRPTALSHGLGSAEGSTAGDGGAAGREGDEGDGPEEVHGDGTDEWWHDDWGEDEGYDYEQGQGDDRDGWWNYEQDTDYDDGWQWDTRYGWFWTAPPSTSWSRTESVARVEETTNLRNGKWVGSQRSWSTRDAVDTQAEEESGRTGRSSEKPWRKLWTRRYLGT